MNLAESRCLKLRRKLAKKVTRMKCNAVIGYRQFIEDEGSESKYFVIRGFGTAIELDKSLPQIQEIPQYLNVEHLSAKKETEQKLSSMGLMNKKNSMNSQHIHKNSILGHGKGIKEQDIDQISHKK